jgi:hypothetical protein
MKTKFYCIYKTVDNTYEIWGHPFLSEKAALASGEGQLLDTYGSKSKEYMMRVNDLIAIDESSARYLGLLP